MIGRIWRGWTTKENAEGYQRLLEREVLPGIEFRARGYEGVYVLRRDEGDHVAFVTLTLWDSLDAIETLVGEDRERAYVPEEARELLGRFDERVLHYEVVHRSPEPSPKTPQVPKVPHLGTGPSIARTWQGWTRARDSDAYVEYLRETGMAEYRATPGNRAAYLLRRMEGDRAEFLTFAVWDSMEAVKAFAGQNFERAVFYPEDDRFLIDRDEDARHYQVVFGPDRTARVGH
jgi:heme-degrading monooxygenase HmoA